MGREGCNCSGIRMSGKGESVEGGGEVFSMQSAMRDTRAGDGT